MCDLVSKRANAKLRGLMRVASLAVLLPIAACNKPSASTGPRTFTSPDEAGKALAGATKAEDSKAILAIFGPGSEEILSTGDATEDKSAMEGFSRAYEVMNRWRKLGDGSQQLLLVGAQNEAFPVPLRKNAAGQWYFDVPAGKDEILARRIGRDELAAVDICAALADSQEQYFSQKHDGVKQYAQKFISDAGQQNGLYWESPQGSPRSPLGPLVAFASEEGYSLKPDATQPYHGYYFRRLQNQGANARGGAKPYVVNGKMTAGFAYVAYPAKYDDTGVQTFTIDQDGVVLEKDLGKDTVSLAKAMTDFNPDQSWTVVQ
jgi:hypothetical protein